MPELSLLHYQPDASGHALLQALDMKTARQARAFHAGLPGAAPTRLWNLKARAAGLGLAAVHIKDESTRFGLNAFKALGASFAVARALARLAGIPAERVSLPALAQARAGLGVRTFVTATDGNHGRGVAWAARLFGHRAVVYMPKGAARTRVDNVIREGGEAVVTDLAYDDCVRLACRKAAERGWILMQDTSWPGYEEVPLDIMRGYTAMAGEIDEQWRSGRPSHVFLQAGVGSFAAAMAAALTSRWPELRVIIVEPDRADCLCRTASINDGACHPAEGDLGSMIAGRRLVVLAMQAVVIRRLRACCFVRWSVAVAALGMRLLAMPATAAGMEGGDSPLARPERDPVIVSGESGAVTMGVLNSLMTTPGLAADRAALGLGPESRVLLISTEGDTAPENYRRVIAGERPSSRAGCLAVGP